MTLIVVFNAILALAIVGAIVALHAHAIVTEQRLHPRRPTLRVVSSPSTPALADREVSAERRAA